MGTLRTPPPERAAAAVDYPEPPGPKREGTFSDYTDERGQQCDRAADAARALAAHLVPDELGSGEAWLAGDRLCDASAG